MNIFISGINNKPKIERKNKGKSLLELPTEYCVIDVETTGLDPTVDHILEIAVIKIKNGTITESFSSLVKHPNFTYVPERVEKITGITTNDILENGNNLLESLKQFNLIIQNHILIGHNVNFDINFLYDSFNKLLESPLTNNYVDTLRLARKALPELNSHKLTTLINHYGLDRQNHRALDDCELTFKVYNNLAEKVINDDIALITKRSRWFDKDFQPETDEIDETNPFYEQNVCFTGTLPDLTRAEAAQIIVNLGGNPQKNVTKQTDFIIAGDYPNFDENFTSSKLKKATKYIEHGQEIHILSQESFLELINEIIRK